MTSDNKNGLSFGLVEGGTCLWESEVGLCSLSGVAAGMSPLNGNLCLSSACAEKFSAASCPALGICASQRAEAGGGSTQHFSVLLPPD